MQPGIYKDILSHDYHASPGISRSGLMLFRQSPRHYWERYVNPNRTPKESTAEQSLGSLVHTMILEPQLFNNEYVVKEKVDGRTTAGKEYNQAFAALHIGKKIINSEDHLAALQMRGNIMKDHAHLIANAKIEHSIYYSEKISGVLCKVRPDILHDNLIVDLKTTRCASARTVSREAGEYGYALQAAMIQDAVYERTGKFINDFVLLCVETCEPYLTVPHMLSETAIERGREEYLKHVQSYKACLDSDTWPAYEPSMIELSNYNHY